MVMKDCLEKNVQKKVLIEKHREYYLVLDEETGAIFLVNETSHFLYENCDGQSVESLCELLFDQCIDKDQLDKRTVSSISRIELCWNDINLGSVWYKFC